VRPDHTAGFRNIRVRQIVNGRALIERGLARGEQVIVEGYFRLENGSRIEITEETPPAKKRTSTAAERG
jgi:membrane fusion protein, multidrug efflux system